MQFTPINKLFFPKGIYIKKIDLEIYDKNSRVNGAEGILLESDDYYDCDKNNISNNFIIFSIKKLYFIKKIKIKNWTNNYALKKNIIIYWT